MARKFGKKNRVSSDIFSHNMALIGESGAGKTTVIHDMCEKVGGPDSYIFFDIGKEDGSAEIEGIVSEPIWTWDKFEEVCDDIIENRNTDYADLRVVVLDTFDELMNLAEQRVIQLWNRENPDKRTTSFKATYGGFNGPTDKAIEIVFDKLWELRRCGVYFISIGHTKRRDVTDPVTNETYSTLTTSIDNRYFNALKNKLAVLGVAYIDREIVNEKTGKKNPVNHKEEIKGKVKSESRVICFRDDNFAIDSKSRFKDIVDKIPLDADALIKALEDAIKKEQARSGLSEDEIAAEQEKIAAEDKKRFDAKIESVVQNRKAEQDESHRQEWITEIRDTIRGGDDALRSFTKEKLNGKKLTDADLPIEILKEIYQYMNS